MALYIKYDIYYNKQYILLIIIYLKQINILFK